MITRLVATLLSTSLAFAVPQEPLAAQSKGKPTPFAKAKPNTASVQSYCEELDFYVSSQFTSARAFVKDNNAKGWRESPKPFSDETKKYIFKALVWIRDGKPVVVSLDHWQKTRKSPDNLKMYFQPNGTITKSILMMDEVTKQGHRVVKGKIQYFDAKGNVLTTMTATKDMKTKKMRKGGNFSRVRIPFYSNFTKLPFYHLLKAKQGKYK